MKKHQFTLLFIVIIATCKASITPVRLDTSEINRQVRELVIDERIILSDVNFFSSIIYLNDSTLLYNPEGTLHLFKIQIDSTTQVTKLDKSTYHGHNFGRKLYLHNSNIYSLGGEGLFNTNSELLYFNSTLKEWLIYPIERLPNNRKSIIFSWLYKQNLNVLYQLQDSKTLLYGTIDLNLKMFKEEAIIKPTSLDQFNLFGSGKVVYTNDQYAIIRIRQNNYGPNVCQYALFNLKESTFLRIFDLEKLECLNGTSAIYIKEDIIIFRNNNSEMSFYPINDLTISSKSNFLDLIKSASPMNKDFSIYKFNILLLLAIVIIIIVVLLKKKVFFRKRILPDHNSNDSTSESEIEILEKNLFQFIGTVISKEILDEALKISHQSLDTMKSNRSIKIRKINERGKLSIIRKRNKLDRRYFEYLIDYQAKTTFGNKKQ